MRVVSAILDAALKAAGVPIHGCASTGRIDFKDEATDKHRAMAASILAAHNYDACGAAEHAAKERAAKIDAEMRRMAEERLIARGEISQ